MTFEFSEEFSSSSKTHSAKLAVIYARVSSTKQVTKGDGLNSQITRCEEYAKFKGYEVVYFFKDDISGSVAIRPAMTKLLAFLKANKKDQHVVIIDDISRLARGLEAHLTLRSDIAEAGGILESPSIEFGEDSDSQFMEHMMAVIAQHQRKKNAEQSKNRMVARAMAGFWVFRAPMGLKFERQAGRGKVLVRHEPLASSIQEALEGFASGRFQTCAEIMRYFETLPYFPRDGRGNLRFHRFKEMLTEPLYAGLLEIPRWNISLRKGQHQGLISVEAFEKIQARRARKQPVMPVYKSISEDFVLRGAVACGDCGWSLTSCWSKGRTKKYPYYICQHKGCDSYGKSIRRETLESEFEVILKGMTPTPKLATILLDLLKDGWGQCEAALANQKRERAKNIQHVQASINKLLERIVDTNSASVIKAYESKIGVLERQKLVLNEKLESTAPVRCYTDISRTALNFLLNPCNLWDHGGLSERRLVLKLAFGSRLVYDRNKGYRTAIPSLPFQLIQRLKAGLQANISPENMMVGDTGIEPVTPTMSM